jgi:hypothetical protein
VPVRTGHGGEEFAMTKFREPRHTSEQIVRPPERKFGNGKYGSME